MRSQNNLTFQLVRKTHNYRHYAAGIYLTTSVSIIIIIMVIYFQITTCHYSLIIIKRLSLLMCGESLMTSWCWPVGQTCRRNLFC